MRACAATGTCSAIHARIGTSRNSEPALSKLAAWRANSCCVTGRGAGRSEAVLCTPPRYRRRRCGAGRLRRESFLAARASYSRIDTPVEQEERLIMTTARLLRRTPLGMAALTLAILGLS